MTGCWPAAAARKTGPKRWPGTRGWCGRSPAAGWRTSSHTRPPIRRGCGPPPPTRRCPRSAAGSGAARSTPPPRWTTPPPGRIISGCAGAGEQARLLAEVPMKMKLADHTTALLPLTPTGTAGALVIRAPVIIAALRGYFEMLWERATPLKGRHPAAPAGGLTATQQMVLELMAEGLHDDAIAHRAEISV